MGRKTTVLNLVDLRFYHLDTCLCPLAGGYLMYFRLRSMNKRAP